MGSRPLCFVLMPFGKKKDPSGGPEIDFDDIYERAIRPGIEGADMDPIRADEELTGGIIHKAMFERLLLCDYAVADLTTANANVFYELGVRHATRSATTLPIFAEHQHIPFDVNALRAQSYRLGDNNRLDVAEANKLRVNLARRLRNLRSLTKESEPVDSPLFQLLNGYGAPDIARLKTDVFREQVRYAADAKRALAAARDARNLDRLKAIEDKLSEHLDGVEAGVLVDLFLSYRALGAWEEMVRLYERLPATLRRTTMLREQLGLALNRAGRRQEAVRVLQKILEEQGPSSETHGILGRIYKDLWNDALRQGQQALAEGYLDHAIDMYVQGFEADPRDAYPGINALTLLDIQGTEQSLERKEELLPVVQYALKRRLKGAEPDYWDLATLLELAVLANDEERSWTHLKAALAAVREVWEPETTANNLSLVQKARRDRGTEQAWLDDVINELGKAAANRS
jgi:tetratricopeptide (TPR) repeat protein